MMRRFAIVAALALSLPAFSIDLGGIGQPKLLDEFSGSHFYYLDKKDRADVLGQLISTIRSQYSLLGIKQVRIGRDFEADATKALAVEAAIADAPDTDDYAQAKSNLDFLDRVTAFVAAFQDTHFGIGPSYGDSPISLGVSIFKADGKFVISGITPKLLAYAAAISGEEEFKKIAKGDELVEYDGRKPDEVIKELFPYISASSDGFREMAAVRALALRTFRYPEKNSVVLLLKKSDGRQVRLRMPWFYKSISRSDLDHFLKHNDFKSADDLGFTFDEKTGVWTPKDPISNNYALSQSTQGLMDLKSYIDDKKSPVMRTGYWIQSGKAYGVLQLYNFYSDKLTRGDEETSYFKVMQEFISELKGKSLPLILDLRRNGGGHGSYPSKVLSILTEKDKTYLNTTDAFRVTRFMRQLLDEELLSKLAAEVIDGPSGEDFRKLVDDAVKSRSVYTDSIQGKDITASKEVGGFDQKIVTLVTPYCISACDMMSMLIKSSGRATIIGTATNGTGAGFMGRNESDTEWVDVFGVFNARIPNFLFGQTGGQSGTYVYKNSVMTLNSENRPTVADVQYSTTVNDIVTGDAGWMSKAVETLEAMPPRVAPTTKPTTQPAPATQPIPAP